MRLWVLPRFGGHKLSKVTRPDVQAFAEGLTEDEGAVGVDGAEHARPVARAVSPRGAAR